jgi:hypothetical protein
MPRRVLARAVLLGIVVVHLVYLIWTPYLNHDTAAYVSAAQMLLRGARPGVEIVDTNPPMVIYLSALPVMVAGWLHVSAPAAALLFFAAMMALGGVLFVRALRIVMPIEQWTSDLVLALWFLWSLRIYWSVGPLQPAGDFGQRDPLVFACLAPFVVVRYARYLDARVPKRLAWLTAAGAAIAIAMKPFFLLPIAGCEFLFAFSFGRVRPILYTIEWWVVLGGEVLYAAHVFVVPGMSELVTRWMPQTARGYSAYAVPLRLVWGRLTHDPHSHLWGAGLLLLCTHPFWKQSRESKLAVAFGWFGALSVVIFVAQAKGWPYQKWPYYGAVMMGTAVLLIDAFRDNESGRARLAAIACACGAILALAVPENLWPVAPLATRLAGRPFSFERSGVAQVIESLSAPGDRVLTLSTRVQDSYPALTYTGRLPASRFVTCAFPVAFYFAGSRDYEVAAGWRQEEAWFYSALVDDVRTSAPRIALVQDAVGQALPAYFRMAEYLRRRGFFDTALARFTPVGRVADFVVYVRDDGRPGEAGQNGTLSLQTNERVAALRRLGVLRSVGGPDAAPAIAPLDSGHPPPQTGISPADPQRTIRANWTMPDSDTAAAPATAMATGQNQAGILPARPDRARIAGNPHAQ